MGIKQESRIIYNPPSGKSWDISGVDYGGKTETYRFFEKMTEPMNQGELAEFSEIEKERGNPCGVNSILLFKIFEAGYNAMDKDRAESENLRHAFWKDLEEFANTLSRVINNSKREKDRVVHNYNMKNQYFSEGNIVGPDDWIENIEDKNVLELLLGEKDILKINKISQWIGHKNSRLSRRLKFNSEDENVVSFSNPLDIFCRTNFFCRRPGFRVLKVE